MEHAPTAAERTPEEIRERIAQIDRAIITLEDNARLAPGIAQESTQGDDDAIESEASDQELGRIRQEIEQLRQEKVQLQEKLANLTKAA